MQTMLSIESPFFIAEDELASPLDWPAVFGNDRPLALEIGCGIGDFVVRTAADRPSLNFIAIDYYNKGCLKTCRRVERHGLANVRVARAEAREFIAEHIPHGSLAAIYINCPDPWPKKRHRKRRLVSLQFVRFLLVYLAPGGELHFATDFDDYALDVAEFMTDVAEMENLLAPDLYRFDLEGYHRSKYMQKFMAEGKNIHFIHYRKRMTGTEEPRDVEEC